MLQKRHNFQESEHFVCLCVCLCVCVCVCLRTSLHWGEESVGPPHKCSHLNWVWPSIFRLEEKKRKRQHKGKRGKINSYTAKVLNMKGWIHRLTLSFWLVPSVSFSLILSLDWSGSGNKRQSLCVCGCVCVCVRGGILQFNVVSVPHAWGSFQRVRQPVVMTLYGKMAQREQSHLHWHFCHHLWLCQQAWSLASPLLPLSLDNQQWMGLGHNTQKQRNTFTETITISTGLKFNIFINY